METQKQEEPIELKESVKLSKNTKGYNWDLRLVEQQCESFENMIKIEIEGIKKDPASFSSRGENKGKLKKDLEKKIEGLERSLEAVKFYSLYETEKKERNLFDYDDILEALNKIVEESEEAKDYIKTNFLYILIDEHQDSSNVQNEFLKRVWSDVEKPNIFVVGDDRQLIYGFGGASLEYFENLHKDLSDKIKTERLISDETEGEIKKVIEKFVESVK